MRTSKIKEKFHSHGSNAKLGKAGLEPTVKPAPQTEETSLVLLVKLSPTRPAGMGPRLWAEVPFHHERQRRTLPTAKESGDVPALSSSTFRSPVCVILTRAGFSPLLRHVCRQSLSSEVHGTVRMTLLLSFSVTWSSSSFPSLV